MCKIVKTNERHTQQQSKRIKIRGLFLSSVATQLTHIAIILASTETSDGDRGTVSQGASGGKG